MSAVRRIAMWSPPRARSTLMMRVFEALGCAVLDEPFYAPWLARLDKRDDPGFAETLAAHPLDPQEVLRQVLGPVPGGRRWFYQKHMAIHMLADFPLSWMAHPEVTNCFLIRDPREVIVSMSEFRDLDPLASGVASGVASKAASSTNTAIPGSVQAAAELVGIPQLLRIYQLACADAQSRGEPPPAVIDANDVLRDPAGTLGAFCRATGMPFNAEAPLAWEAGQHDGDGAWAPFWYQKVFATTGLQAYHPKSFEVPAALQPVVEACLPAYQALYAQRLSAG